MVLVVNFNLSDYLLSTFRHHVRKVIMTLLSLSCPGSIGQDDVELSDVLFLVFKPNDVWNNPTLMLNHSSSRKEKQLGAVWVRANWL